MGPQTQGTLHEQLWPCVLWQFAPEALPAVPVLRPALGLEALTWSMVT